MSIETGLVHENSWIVGEQHTAAAVTEGKLPKVLSTPHLIGWIESTAHNAIADSLAVDQASVGTSISVKHMAATPVGMQVKVRVELLEVSGRRLRYKVEAWDAIEKICEGEHERFIIDTNRFAQNLEKKRMSLPPGI